MTHSFKVGELMKDAMINPDFEGFSTADDWVFAIDISGGRAANVDEYEVLQLGISGVDAALEAQTEDANYIRGGQSSLKTGTQRTFTVSGDRYIGNAAQDFMFSHAVKFGTGQTVIVPYAYFSILTGKGETGIVSVIVNSDAAGEAGSKTTIDVEFRTTGEAPKEFTYIPLDTLETLTVTSTAGNTTGKTELTVTPSLTSGHAYRYKTDATVKMPLLNEDLSAWDVWDGSAEITANNGDDIVVAEVNEKAKAKKAGKTTAIVGA